MKDETVVTYSKYCCLLCCWETEPVKISARVPMKGYAPGQAIEITIVVDNKSDQTYDSFIGNIYKVSLRLLSKFSSLKAFPKTIIIYAQISRKLNSTPTEEQKVVRTC